MIEKEGGMAQSKRFSGFEEADFKIFDIENLEERIKKIKERIHPKLGLLALEVLYYFKTCHRLPVPLCPYYAGHNRNFVNSPSATWLALGRYQDKYVDYAQLNVGLSKQFDVRIRLGFPKGKKSVDFPKFKKWINRDKNREYVKELIKGNGFVFFLGKKCVKNKEILYEVIRETTSIDEALLLISSTSATWFEIGKQYNKTADIVRSSELVGEVIKVFKKLYPIYKEIGQAE